MGTLLNVGYKGVASVDTTRATRVELTILTPSCWEEGTGYAPAESVSVQMSKVEAKALADALLSAASEKQVAA